MAKRIISTLMLMVSCLFTAMPSGGYARKQDNADEEAWFQTICKGNEKLAKLHFYVHEVPSGENATLYEVARASITFNSPTAFGQILVVDEPLTAEPDRNSKKLGRSHSFVTSSDLKTTAMTMVFNLLFTSGKYNGSSLIILGRNQIGDEERELPVVGGTGVFRFTRGYAITRTFFYDFPDYVVLEYTVYATYVSRP